ncbi:MAG: hypothetical protein GF332_03115 [Candidatus Moranbacteria bacterium]|nr:hypothetical protein [Candidatus Moranbacteria bacterium]
MLDSSSSKNRNMTTFFISFLAYSLVTTLSVSDLQLLIPSMDVKLPILSISISLFDFFILTPILIIIFHFQVLANMYNHLKKLFVWQKKKIAMTQASLFQKIASKKEDLSIELNPFFLDFSFSDNQHINPFKFIYYFSIYIFPLSLLLIIFIRFGDYQNPTISAFHLILTILDVIFIVIYKLKINNCKKRLELPCQKNWLGWTMSTILVAPILAFSFYYWLVIYLAVHDYNHWIVNNYYNCVEKTSHPQEESANKFSCSLIPFELFFPNIKINPNTEIPLPSLDQIDSYQDFFENNQKTHFPKLDLSYRKLNYASLSQAYLPYVNLKKSSLNSANLWGAYLKQANLTETEFQEAFLTEVKMPGANLTEAKLQGANLWFSELDETDLRQANLQGADLLFTQLNGADLTQAQLQGASLFFNGGGIEMRGADLNNAQLQGLKLSKVNLQGADLFQTQLQGTDLSEAKLQGALINGANLYGADLKNTNLDLTFIFNINFSQYNWTKLKKQFPEISNQADSLELIAQADQRSTTIKNQYQKIIIQTNQGNIQNKLNQLTEFTKELDYNSRDVYIIQGIWQNLHNYSFNNKFSDQPEKKSQVLYEYWRQQKPDLLQALLSTKTIRGSHLEDFVEDFDN